MKKIIVFIILLSFIPLFGKGNKGNGKKMTIAGIVIQNDIYMRTVQIGMKETADKLGVELLLGNSDNKVDKESQLIDTYITRGVKAIIIQPLSFKGSAAALQRAADAGIKIILMGTKADVPYQKFFASENLDIGKGSGKVAKDFIDKKLKGQKVEVGTISFVAQYPEAAKDRTNGFLNEISGLPQVKVVSQQDAWLAEMAIRVVGDMLTANPDIKIIHAANEGGTVGAVQAVKNAGKQGQVFVFGTDGSEQIIQLLNSPDNILQVATAQRPYTIGKLGVEAAVDAVNGKKFDEKDTIVPTRPLKRGDTAELKSFSEELKKLK